MKKIYLIRHGESKDNSLNLESRNDTPLSEKGEKQSQFLGKRFVNIEVNKIISSPFVRARQTAEAIASQKGLPVEFSDLFVERRVPSEIIGKSFESEELKSVYATLNKNYFIEEAYYSDEENFQDLKVRAGKALAYIESFSVDHIVVTTHGMFLSMLIAYMIFGNSVTSKEFIKIFSGFKNSNTGITWCEYDSAVKADDNTGWKLFVWNDNAHLG